MFRNITFSGLLIVCACLGASVVAADEPELAVGHVVFAIVDDEESPSASAQVIYWPLREDGRFQHPETALDKLVMPNRPSTGVEVNYLTFPSVRRDYAYQKLKPGRYALNNIALRELSLFGNAYQSFHEHESRLAFTLAEGEVVVLRPLQLYKYKAEKRKGFKGKGLWSVTPLEDDGLDPAEVADALEVDPKTVRFVELEAEEVDCQPVRAYLRFKRCSGVKSGDEN